MRIGCRRELLWGLPLAACLLFPAYGQESPVSAGIAVKAVRSGANPLITRESSSSLGRNINGPSVVRMPEWAEGRLGKYHMYFAAHRGAHIRLAYSDAIEGPWKVHEPGTLQLAQAAGFTGHIASPDVHVDDAGRRILMYFHGKRGSGGQFTALAVSKDGLTFKTDGTVIAPPYLRTWTWNGRVYGVARRGKVEGEPSSGQLMTAESAEGPFAVVRDNFIPRMRHAAVLVEGDRLLLFYSRIGDAPERIVMSVVEMKPDVTAWRCSPAVDVLVPEGVCEGGGYDIAPSKAGSATKVRELRDPCVFHEEGKSWLFYSIAGESGIAAAELDIARRR